MNNIDKNAQIIWDYMHLGHDLQKADVIIGFGSHDKRTAVWAAELYNQGYAPFIIFSGHEGVGREVSSFEGLPEAEVYRAVALQAGVPSSAIIVETASTNSSENVLFTAELISQTQMNVKRAIVVQKPYMERRAYATIKAQWPQPQPEIIMSSMPIAYRDYVADPLYSKDYTINVLVGDLQRIKEYPSRGFQIHQAIPVEVWRAFEALVEVGYTKHLL